MLSVRMLVLLALCVLSTQAAQLADADAPLGSSDPAQLVFEDPAAEASSYPGSSLVDHIAGDFYHYLANVRDWIGWTEDSYSLTMVSNAPQRAPPIVEPRLSYSQTCSIKTFSHARRTHALDSTLDKCKKHLRFTRPAQRQNETSRAEEEEPVLFRGCCQARHYGVLQTCVKITFDGSNPDDMLNETCLCRGKTL